MFIVVHGYALEKWPSAFSWKSLIEFVPTCAYELNKNWSFFFRYYWKYGEKVIHWIGASFYSMFANLILPERCWPNPFALWKNCWKPLKVRVDSQNANLTTRPKFFCQKSENDTELYIFFKSNIFTKNFLWTRRMRFDNPTKNFLLSFWKKLVFCNKIDSSRIS